MNSTEFKSRLANGDKLAVVMFALFKSSRHRVKTQKAFLRLEGFLWDEYEERASHILAALASAEAAKNEGWNQSGIYSAEARR